MTRAYTCSCLNLVQDLSGCPLGQPPTGQDIGGLFTGPKEAQADQGVPAISLPIQLVYLTLQVRQGM